MDSIDQWITYPESAGLPPVEVDGLKTIDAPSIYLNSNYALSSSSILFGEGHDPHNVQELGMSGSLDFDSYNHSPATMPTRLNEDPLLSPFLSDTPYLGAYGYDSSPGMSPDCSPASVASSSMLRTPENGEPLPVMGESSPTLTEYEALPDITDVELSYSSPFLSQHSDYALEGYPYQGVMQEDLACTPIPQIPLELAHSPAIYTIGIVPPSPSPVRPSGTSISRATTPQPVTPIASSSSQLLALPSPRTQPEPSRQTGRSTSLPPVTPSTPQHMHESSPLRHPTPLRPFTRAQSARPATPSFFLSPLALQFPRSPSLSPLTPSPVSLPSLSPALSCVSLGDVEIYREPTPVAGPSTSNATASPLVQQAPLPSEKVLGKRRRRDSLADGADIPKISKHCKAAKVDEDEWIPTSSRPKRRAAAACSSSSQVIAGPSMPPEPSPKKRSTKTPKKSPSNTPALCSLCVKTFTRTSDRNRHVKSKHWSVKLPCPYCKLKFSREDSLNRHIKSHHPKE
ncbi:hypothetical protein HYDPIDRAFT_31958 [Hydnomerulius pinastri MD-312]|uniref:C2H2-type domain-containing protein n=1 Tax=Hydnomerulius pinastri MD-312 TaxID=994086 RepID=A0A0C9VSA9_9AGAM|nr:hypothetical protein HYDPIDRAFT_31958 [Hydnomerulius pinastri MD-312]